MTDQEHGGAPPQEVLPSIPGYEALCELGRGGMGVVYKARKLADDRLVALKMILGAPLPGFLNLARFCLEAQAVACLDHPNIVKLYDVSVLGGYPFFTLEYAPGGDLAQKIQGRPQPPRWCAQIALVLAEALHHAHQRGILHRDLKPSNILIMANGALKISDFGLVKFSRSVWDVINQHGASDFLRADEMVALSKSLMPEGLEKEITLQDMANLIGYVRDQLRSRPDASR
jgi:serine/threonine-protein kinase